MNNSSKFLFKAEKKVGMFFNQAIVINVELFFEVFQCNIWSSHFSKNTNFDVQTTLDSFN